MPKPFAKWPEMRQVVYRLLPELALQTLEAIFQVILDRHQEILGFDRQIARFVRDDQRVSMIAAMEPLRVVPGEATPYLSA